MKKITSLEFGVLTLIILITALSRLIPHPYNFSPVCAIALFGAYYYRDKYFSYIMPLLSMWISDLILNNTVYSQHFSHFTWLYDGAFVTYTSFILIVYLGTVLLKRLTLLRLFFTSITSSVVFYLVSNFGVWLFSSMLPYPHTFRGLLSCYGAGMPFFKNTLLGDYFYIFLLFGAYELFIKYMVNFWQPSSVSRNIQSNDQAHN